MAALAPILVVDPGREEEAWRRFAWIRSAYDPALRALAGLDQWPTPRPGRPTVRPRWGEPRFLRRRPLHVDWSIRRTGAAAPVAGATATGG